jgi:hypothetical protein
MLVRMTAPVPLQAAEEGKPVAILTDGDTRADPLAGLKLETRCSETLQELHQMLYGKGQAL